MSFDGISLWSAEQGIPNSHGQALTMREQIKEQGISADKKTKQAFVAVAQAIEEFLAQAKPYFGDDDVFDYYQDLVSQTKDEDYPVFEIDYAPEGLIIEFSAPIIKVAREHNLVVMHNNLEAVFLPDGRVILVDEEVDWQDFVAHTEQTWQQKLAELEQEASMSTMPTDDDSLPESQTQINKIVNDMVKARFKQAGIKQKRKVGKTAYYFEYERIQVVFWINAKNRTHETTPDGNVIIDFFSCIEIYINDIPSGTIKTCADTMVFDKYINITMQKFYRGTEHAVDLDIETMMKVFSYLGMPISSLSDLKHQVALALDMFVHILPHCQDAQSLYKLLRSYDKAPEDIDDEYQRHLIRPQNMLALNKLMRQKLIAAGEISSYVEPLAKPHMMLALAKITQQPNFKELIAVYKEEYISARYFNRVNGIRKKNWREKRKYEWSKARNEHEQYVPEFKPEVITDEAIKAWEQSFDEMLDYIDSIDVEAILNAPPNRMTDFGIY